MRGAREVDVVSRLERGFASPPLYAYVRTAEALGVAPGVLLVLDGLDHPVSDAEVAVVKIMRRLALTPDEAIARLAGLGDRDA